MKIILKSYLVIYFLLYYFFKVIQANWYITTEILTPGINTNPGFVWISLKVNSDLGILLFSNLLSMTPGTLSVDISDDKSKLLVHCLYVHNEEDMVRDIEKMQSEIIKLIS